MAGFILLGIFGAALGQFILMRGFGVRRTLLFLQTFILCALIGVVLAFLLIMLLMGAVASSGRLLMAVGMGLIIGGICGWLALQYERIMIIINLVLYMLVLMVAIVIATAITKGFVLPLVIVLLVLMFFAVKLAWAYTLLIELVSICLFGAAASTIGTVSIFTGLGIKGMSNPVLMVMGLLMLTVAGTIYQTKRYQVLKMGNRV